MKQLQCFHRGVCSVEISASSFLGDDKELLQRSPVFDDIWLSIPRWLVEEGGDRLANVKAVGEHDWDVTRSGNASHLVGDVNGECQAREV